MLSVPRPMCEIFDGKVGRSIILYIYIGAICVNE